MRDGGAIFGKVALLHIRWTRNIYSLPLVPFEINPVRSNLREKAENYPWSSAAFHAKGETDPLVNKSPLVEMVTDWQGFLAEEFSASMISALKRAERTGRPLGDDKFLANLGLTLGRDLTKKNLVRNLANEYGVSGIMSQPG